MGILYVQPCKLCLRDVTSMVQIQVECSRLMFEDAGPGFGARIRGLDGEPNLHDMGNLAKYALEM